jgi:threonine aldolase
VESIDLRSDTVTKPTPQMRAAIAAAEVGDDVYGEDPSVNRLEALAAERLGKAAAIFVPSGTMANQVAIRALSSPGDVILIGEDAHILLYEGGAAAALSGVQLQTLGTGGFFEVEELLAAIPPDDVHCAPVTTVALENTHNASGGRVMPQAQLERVAAAARSAGLSLHLDGARIFNAAVASGRSTAEIAVPFDTVCFCLSKGLGCPVGSVVCADRETIRRIRRIRKLLGGSMRQAGFLAAAGTHALEHHVERLADDHANAARLADGLRSLGMETRTTETNMVVFSVDDADGFVRQCRQRGVLLGALDATHIRAVTHLDVSEAQIDGAIERLAEALEA